MNFAFFNLLLFFHFEYGLGNALKKSQLVKKLMDKKYVREGSLRLVGGRGNHEGNVEIFHKGRWGSVCDDEWDLREANIVCSNLGYETSRPTFASHFGAPRGNYFMDNLYCEGTERNLPLCRFDGWGVHDCDQNEAAGVICVPKPGRPKTLVQRRPKEKQTLREAFGNIQLSLVNGRHKSEGRIEIKTPFHDGGVLCGDGWRLIEANIVCKQLGLGFASSATQNHFFEDESLNITLSGIECVGNEKSLIDCKISSSFYCPGQLVAGVICTPKLADLSIDMEEMEKSAYLEDRPIYLLQCAMEENCLGSSAYSKNKDHWHLETRRLLRFTAKVTNVGDDIFQPFLPKYLWQFHQCHMHYHSMEVFATFDVLSDAGVKIAEGHKASFCLEDNECQHGGSPRFACANYGDQGISPNCSDIYRHNIDCQWVDISDMDTGQYYFKVKINPEFKIAEKTFENNEVTCRLIYTPNYARIFNCKHTG